MVTVEDLTKLKTIDIIQINKGGKILEAINLYRWDGVLRLRKYFNEEVKEVTYTDKNTVTFILQ